MFLFRECDDPASKIYGSSDEEYDEGPVISSSLVNSPLVQAPKMSRRGSLQPKPKSPSTPSPSNSYYTLGDVRASIDPRLIPSLSLDPRKEPSKFRNRSASFSVSSDRPKKVTTFSLDSPSSDEQSQKDERSRLTSSGSTSKPKGILKRSGTSPAVVSRQAKQSLVKENPVLAKEEEEGITWSSSSLKSIQADSKYKALSPTDASMKALLPDRRTSLTQSDSAVSPRPASGGHRPADQPRRPSFSSKNLRSLVTSSTNNLLRVHELSDDEISPSDMLPELQQLKLSDSALRKQYLRQQTKEAR